MLLLLLFYSGGRVMKINKYEKRFASVLMALLVFLETLPFSAFAENDIYHENPSEENEFCENINTYESANMEDSCTNESKSMEKSSFENVGKEYGFSSEYYDIALKNEQGIDEPVTNSSSEEKVSLNTDSSEKQDFVEALDLSGEINSENYVMPGNDIEKGESWPDYMPSGFDTDIANDGTVANAAWDVCIFPEGTSLQIDAVDNEYASEIGRLALGNDTKILNAVAYDISFIKDSDGRNIQPYENGTVYVELELPFALPGDHFYLVHIMGDGQFEFIPGADVSVQLMDDGSLQATGVSFEGAAFSVYTLLSTDETGRYARRTYEFYANNTLFASQTVTKEDYLADPGIPTLSDNAEFLGWYRIEDESRKSITLDELRSELSEANIYEGETICIYAIISHTHTISYLDEDNNVIKSVKVYDGDGFSVSENYEPKNKDRVFKGWRNGEELYSVGERIDSVSCNLVLEPKLNRTFNLTFHMNCGDDIVSVIPPVVVEEGKDLSLYLPNAERITRPGYVFIGWFHGKDENGSITLEGDEITDGLLTGDETLYAKWEYAKQTSFSVQIWKQSLEDDYRIGLTAVSPYYDEANDKSSEKKSYVYDKTIQLYGKTGDEVSSSDGFKDCLAPDEGFYLGGIEYQDSDGNETGVISSNGETVVNIYFDRQVWTLTLNSIQNHYVEDAESKLNVYGKTEYGEDYFPVFYLCTVEEAGDNQQMPQYGTTNNTDYFKIYYRRAYSFVERDQSNNNLYRINDSGTKYVQIYYNKNDGNYHYEQSANSPVYTGIRYAADAIDYKWVKADSSYGVEYSGTRYLEPVYRWYTGNSTLSNQYNGIRYRIEMENSYSLFYGLYGQDFQKYNYVLPDDTVWNETKFINSFTDIESFAEDPKDETTRNCTISAESTSTESSTITVVYYCLGTDGKLYKKRASSSYRLENDEEYYTSNPFPGMSFSEYFWSNSTDDPGEAVAWLTGLRGDSGEISCGVKGANSVLHLRYVPEYYRLIFKDARPLGEETILKTIEIPYGSSLTEYRDQAPSSMSKEDYAFTGWFLDSQCTVEFNWAGKMYDSDVTVYAGWEKCNYRVVINLCDDEAYPATYNSELSVLVPAFERIKLSTPSRSGYQYIGLYSDPDYDQEFSETMAISAAIKEMDMNYPSSLEYANGLEENSVLIHGAERENDHVAGKLNLYVKWEKVESVSIRIAYDANGGDNVPVDPDDYYGQDYAAAHSICTPPDGKAFLCWTYRDVTTGKEEEVYPGHYFPLQQAEKTITEENENRILTVILKAKYVEKQMPGKITVVFDPNGGVGDYSITVEANLAFTVPSQDEAGIVRDGYRLLGWNTAADGNGDFFEIGENAAANTSGTNMLYAVWDPEITLLFTVNKTELGSVDKDRITVSRHKQESISVTAMANEHCIFTGWFLNGEIIDTDNILYLSIPEDGWMIAEYQAVFERETLTVSYVLGAEDTENAPGMQRIPYGERAIRPKNPIRNGYRFTGWKNGERDYDFALPVTKNLTLTAQWEQEFYISYAVFSDESGVQLDVSPIDDEGYLPGETVTVQENPMSPVGYENFTGWNTKDAQVLNGSFIMPANNVAFTGMFTPILYKITYDMQGGRTDGDNPNLYSIESDSVTLKNPIREGYVFCGWTGSNGTEAQTEVTIPAESIGDRSYTAIWSPSHSTAYHVVVHYPDGWTMPESMEGAEINPGQKTASYTCKGMTGSSVDTSVFQSPDDQCLAYDAENPQNLQSGVIEPDGSLVLHVYLKHTEYHYTIQFCLRGTGKTVATKTGIAEPDSNGTAVTVASLENAVFVDEYIEYASRVKIVEDNQVTVSKDNTNVVVPLVIKVCIDRMDDRELYANGQEQNGYSINEITGTAFISDSVDGHVTVSGLLPGDSMKIDFTPASGTYVGTYMPVCNSVTFNASESAVSYYTFDGFDSQTMGLLTILNTVTVTWKNGDEVLLTDPYVSPGSIPIYGGKTPEKEPDDRYTYSFNGWNSEVGPVNRNTTYEAVFSKSFRQYTVTWENWDGTVAWQKEYIYGSTPVYGGPGQEKPEDVEYSYAFSSWTPAISEVDGNAVYKPVFARTPKEYHVTYKLNGETYGSVLKKPFGETIMLSEDPQREGYTFSGWSSEDVLIENRTLIMPSKDIVIVGSLSKIEKQVFDSNNLTEAQKTVAATGLTYNGTEQDLVRGPVSLPEGYTGVSYSTDGGKIWNTALPKGMDAGEYTVLVQYIGDSYHESFIMSELSVIIGKAIITTFRASVFEELVYTGEERVFLASASGLPEGASVEYLVCDIDNHIHRDWSDELPCAVIPGCYQVYYRINGGNNYLSVSQTRIDNGNNQNTVITKANQTLPRKPLAVATNAHSISVDQPLQGQEYVVMPIGQVPTGNDWAANSMISSDGETLVFNSLTACQDYVVYTRKAETDCYNASDYIASETVVTPKELQNKPISEIIATVTCTSITVNPADTAQEYSLDLGNRWISVPAGETVLTFTDLKPDTEYKLSTRMAETATAFASDGTEPITIKTMTGKILTEIRKGDTSVPNVAVKGLNEQLAKKLNNPDELEMVLYGQNETVYLLVSNIMSNLSVSDKVLVEKAAKEKNNNSVVFMCLDISLFKQIEDKSPVAITSTGTDTIDITLTIPEQFRNYDPGIIRSFYIVRIHGGNVEVLQPTVSGNNIIISTGRFSTYALFYVDRSESFSDTDEKVAATVSSGTTTGTNGTTIPTAASISVTGTTSSALANGITDTSEAGSTTDSKITEPAETVRGYGTARTEEIKNHGHDTNAAGQEWSVYSESGLAKKGTVFDDTLLLLSRGVLFLLPLGLMIIIFLVIRSRRNKREHEE